MWFLNGHLSGGLIYECVWRCHSFYYYLIILVAGHCLIVHNVQHQVQCSYSRIYYRQVHNVSYAIQKKTLLINFSFLSFFHCQKEKSHEFPVNLRRAAVRIVLSEKEPLRSQSISHIIDVTTDIY